MYEKSNRCRAQEICVQKRSMIWIGGNLQKLNKRKIGTEKEAFVCEWLEKQGYEIVERNFRCRSGEIDIVAREGGYLVFVEVKYRSRSANGLPQEAVDTRKQRVISRVALYYLCRYGYGGSTPVRFDVVAVFGEKDFSVALYQNAFDFCP